MDTWIMSSTALLLAVLLVRFCFKKKISRILRYALWLPVVFRLLIPVMPFESRFSIMNFLPEWGNTAENGLNLTDSGEGVEVTDIGADSLAQLEMVSGQAGGSVNKQGTGVNGQTVYEVNSPDMAVNGDTQGNLPVGNIQGTDITENADNIVYTDTLQPDTVVTIKGILLAVWVIGSLVTGVVLLLSNLQFYHNLKRTRKVYEPGQEYKGKLPVYKAEGLLSPCLFGVLRPAIYVTEGIEGSEVCRAHVLCHENCHFRHGDHIWSWVRGICLSLWWWHPLVWVAARLSVKDAEFACDEAVLKSVGEESNVEYGRTLVAMIPVQGRGNVLCAATTMASSSSTMKERLYAVVNKPKHTFCMAVLAVGIMVLGTACTVGGKINNEKPMEPEVTLPEKLPVQSLVVPEASEVPVIPEEAEAPEVSEKENSYDPQTYYNSLTNAMLEERMDAVKTYLAEEGLSKKYDYYLIQDITPISPTEWEETLVNGCSLAEYPFGYVSDGISWLDYLMNHEAVLVKATVMYRYTGEYFEVGPQFGDGNITRYVLVENTEEGIKLQDWSMPEGEEQAEELRLDNYAYDLMKQLGINQKQYMNLLHQTEGLWAAGIDHDFTTYTDFTEEECKRYLMKRTPYFGVEENAFSAHESLLLIAFQYDFSDENLFGAKKYGIPDYLKSDGLMVEYGLSDLEKDKENVTVSITSDPYLIEEGLIGQLAEVQYYEDGEITRTITMEYRFAFTGDGRLYIAGGSVIR